MWSTSERRDAKEAVKEEYYNNTGQEMKDRKSAGRNKSAFIEELASTKVEASAEINSTPVPSGETPTGWAGFNPNI